jgi:hypothetical protein
VLLQAVDHLVLQSVLVSAAASNLATMNGQKQATTSALSSPEETLSAIDPSILQAVLTDPVLLQAVDPLVLQAVLDSAAASNLAIPNFAPPAAIPPAAIPPADLPVPASNSQTHPIVFSSSDESYQDIPLFESSIYNLPQVKQDPQQIKRTIETDQPFQEQSQIKSFVDFLMTRPKLRFEEQEIQPDQKRVQDELGSFQLINLPAPTYGNPDPMITHIGAPLPPGTVGEFSVNSQSDANEKQPAIQF